MVNPPNLFDGGRIEKKNTFLHILHQYDTILDMSLEKYFGMKFMPLRNINQR